MKDGSGYWGDTRQLMKFQKFNHVGNIKAGVQPLLDLAGPYCIKWKDVHNEKRRLVQRKNMTVICEESIKQGFIRFDSQETERKSFRRIREAQNRKKNENRN